MLAVDGHCKTFDANANGYVRGEGCGVVVLKRLSDAQRDGNIILAVLKASAVNQDGASSGLTVPNGDAQESLIRKVLDKAKLKGSDIDYVEAHGTGTPLGDPIEVRAIGATYGVRKAEYPLKLGSVKTNIGHLEGAAGIASVIKVILALQHETLPKQLHFTKLNPHIDLSFPAEILTQNSPWPRGERTRRAAVSSFGFSGTNAHVIVEEGPTLSAEQSLLIKQRFLQTPPYNRKRYWARALDIYQSTESSTQKTTEVFYKTEWIHSLTPFSQLKENRKIILLSVNDALSPLTEPFQENTIVSNQILPDTKLAISALLEAAHRQYMLTDIVIDASSVQEVSSLENTLIKFLYITQAIAEIFKISVPRVYFVTTNNPIIFESVRSMQLTILREMPTLLLLHLGLEIVSDDFRPTILKDIFFQTQENSLHCHGQEFLVPRLRRVENYEQSDTLKIGSTGIYLITGGLGAIGLKIAKWLLQQGAGTVVITARRALDERSQSSLDISILLPEK